MPTCGGIFDLEAKEKEASSLALEMENPSFWDNPENAQKVIAKRNELTSWTETYKEVKERFEAIEALFPKAEGDSEMVSELTKELNQVEKEIASLEARRMLSGELDNSNCFLNINAGAGGTEACDWVAILSRMYQRWAEKRRWKVEIIDSLPGEVAGIKNITFKFSGKFAYGYTKAEKGVHRLVRISPFDSGGRRHTSFASVDVTPEVADDIVIEIKPSEIRIDTFRSSGAGGQHVNVTDSAVRITHLPTGIVVSCQSERSQLQNKETCLKILRSKLYEKQMLEREESLKGKEGEKKQIAWGSQIRNYVFQPYTLVKDVRTGVETSNVEAMMNGELLDDFIIAYLKEFA